MFKFLAGLTARAKFDVSWRDRIVVTKHGIMPTFDVQIRIISRSEQGVHNL